MLTQSVIRETHRRRARLLLVAGAVVMLMMTLWCVPAAVSRDAVVGGVMTGLGISEDAAATLLFACMFVTVLLPFGIAGWHGGRNPLACPDCGEDVMSRHDRLLATRCCPHCDGHIVEGRPRSLAAHVRQTRYHCRNHMLLGLWALTACGVAMSLMGFRGEPLTPVIGAAIAGMILVGYRDRRFILPLVVSAVLLVDSAVFIVRSFAE